MSLPGNGIFVVQGEMNMLVTAMRRSTRWGSHSFANEEFDVLMRAFQDLKSILNNVDDLRLLDPATYLGPFLEVVRSKETTGPVTNSALSAINKFLSYGLIDPTHASVPAAVEDIADAVTHARFVGTDPSADGIVLTNILQVLRTLMLSPEGALLTDESVCEIMLTCFRIFFETRLIELLRRNAEQCLRDMTQLIFMRLPQFAPEDLTLAANLSSIGLSLKKRDKNTKKKSLSQETKSPSEPQSPTEDTKNKDVAVSAKIPKNKHIINESEIIIEPDAESIKSPTKKHIRHSSMDLATNGNTSITQLLEKCVTSENSSAETESEVHEEEKLLKNDGEVTEAESVEVIESIDKEKLEEYVNHRGVRFTAHDEVPNLAPYGLSCVRELLKFLISLCNPHDEQNTPSMIHLGLCLLDTAFEVAGDHMATFPSLLYLIKDPLCRNLLSLLGTEEISIFTLNLQVSFLLFESLRFHLKYQMEAFFKKLIEIISTDTTKALRLKEIHHIALESLAQMFRIPGLCTELYLNYDCDIYCTNVFEELTKLLSKNVISSTASNIHMLSLEALMTIIEAIENASCDKQMADDELFLEKVEPKFGRAGHVSLELGGMDDASIGSVTECSVSAPRVGRTTVVSNIPSEAELDKIKTTKKWIATGTELFNQKPERGIEFLQEHGVLTAPLDPHQVAMFLRENPDLDKKMIGEYICKRSTIDSESGHTVLAAFASSFDFSGLRIDTALRMYLETFRLPGEAPLIFLVMEKFAEQWHVSNGEPFANTDAAFRLAYAVIMLNMDQHNNNAKKLNLPMNAEDFVKNLRGLNGNDDFDQTMLEAIYNAIKNEEMVMPAERSGLVREAYLWRVLQRRGNGATYLTAHPLLCYKRLFAEAVAPTVSALSAAFERSTPPTQEDIDKNNIRDNVALLALNGIERCAALIAKQHATTEQITIDTLLLTLCKFTGLLLPTYNNYIAIGVTLGQSTKAQLALRRAFAVCARHADNVKDSWKHLMEIIKTLYIGRLLPKSLIEAEDYLSPTGTVSLIRDTSSRDAGLLSSIYSYIALGDSSQRTPSIHERSLILAASNTVEECNLNTLLWSETKFLHLDSLQELVRAMVTVGAPPDCETLQLNPQLEDITLFFLELLGQTLIQNRDRLQTVWPEAGAHIKNVMLWSTSSLTNLYLSSRTLTALLRTSARLMRSENCAPTVLANLTVLFALPYKLFYLQADIISCGLYELVKTSAQNVHSGSDWDIVFALLCAAGAGVWPRDGTASPTVSSRSEGSEDESDRRPTSASSENELSQSPHAQGWIVVNNKGSNKHNMDDVYMRAHQPSALCRCTEALSLVVRDVAHVTPDNVTAAVRAVRVFAAAASNARKKLRNRNKEVRKSRSSRRKDSSDDEEDPNDQYYIVSMQLLDLMHTLHSRTAQIFRWWREEAEHNQNSEEYDLWEVAWMPLLQGIAQFCTDSRKQVASSAIAYLQRALLSPALVGAGSAASTARGWESTFNCVLFPLLDSVPVRAKARANTILCKVFLHHLSALSSRPTFASLWLSVIQAQRTLVEKSPPDDPLTEAALESLKNMILVMDSVKIFSNGEGYTDLWYLTWEKIGEFLPHLKEELFPEAKTTSKSPQPLTTQIPTLIPQNTPSLVPIPPQNLPSIVPISPQNVPLVVPIPPPPTLVPNVPQYPTTSQSAFVAYSQTKIPSSTPGMVPIRNQLYAQGGLASSVLLQPLNEMVATSLSITLPSQMPILLPSKIENVTATTQALPTKQANTEKRDDTQTNDSLEPCIIEVDRVSPDSKRENELYSEYISSPFADTKDKYEPLEKAVYDKIINEKSLSVDSSPMHKPLAHFASTDNVKNDVFNFSNYFGSVSNVIPPGSEILYGSTPDG